MDSGQTLPSDKQAQLKSLAERLRRAVSKSVVGADDAVDMLMIAILAGGHVLLEGVPGTAKTTLAKSMASALGLHYNRIQFTPDLLPSDVTGNFILDRNKNEFELRKGPIFCQLLLADEVNRAPAKTQASLLEAMQELQVTIEGQTMPLPRPFVVLATQNPIEQEGVYRLPEAQLDRFLLRVEIHYPSRDTEIGILELLGSETAATRAVQNGKTASDSVTNPTELMDMQRLLASVHAEPTILHYAVDLARTSREHPDLALGASPRATLSLIHAAKARALLYGRAYVTHEDIQRMLVPVWSHRMILRAEAELEGQLTATVIQDLLKRVPTLAVKK